MNFQKKLLVYLLFMGVFLNALISFYMPYSYCDKITFLKKNPEQKISNFLMPISISLGLINFEGKVL